MMRYPVAAVVLFFYITASFSDTQLKLFRPFGEAINQVTLAVEQTLQGECMVQSQHAVREDAWRCHAQGKLFDPCFVNNAGDHKKALCPQSPWFGGSIEIEVKTPLNNKNHQLLDMARAYPWGIELAQGVRCVAIDSNLSFESMPIRYRCSDQTLLVGHLQRCDPQWTMLEKTPKGIITVDVMKAWF